MNLEPSSLTPPNKSLLNSHQVAERLGVSERWVRDHAGRRSPKIPVVRLGPLVRFRPADIEAFIDDQLEDHSGTKRKN